MADFSKVLQQLRTDKTQTERQLKRLGEAISALQKIDADGGRSARVETKRRSRRKVSKTARKRMAAAQKARWAKLRQQKAA
jgi:ribosomal protein S2